MSPKLSKAATRRKLVACRIAEVNRHRLAEDTGLSVSYISKICNGQRSPTWDNAKVIALKLRIEPQELMNRITELRDMRASQEAA